MQKENMLDKGKGYWISSYMIFSIQYPPKPIY